MTFTDVFHGLRRALSVHIAGAAALLAGAGWAHAQTPGYTPAASGVEYRLIGTYDLARLDRIFGTELDEFMASSTMPTEFRGKFPPARFPVKLYRVKYSSVVPEWNNKPTVASGLVAVPETGAKTMPMVSYQHGTVFDRSYVPSNPDSSMETRIMIARFASQGYAVIGADYFGRGESDLPDSYLVKRSTQQATYDMLQASKAVLASLGTTPGKLFVSGWSQGGWATMAFLQKLESVGEPVTAAAAASAPVDIYVTLTRWMNNPQPVDAPYLPGVLAIQLQAHENYHGLPGLAETAIKPEYLAAARDLYAGRMDFTAFFKATKPTIGEFLKPEFRASADLAEGGYWRVLETNEAYRWRMKTPLRTYNGGQDEVTPLGIALLPELAQGMMGGAPAKAVDVGPKADHRAVFIGGVIDQKGWFDGLLGR